jgi:hypothetical protein
MIVRFAIVTSARSRFAGATSAAGTAALQAALAISAAR